MSSEHWTTVEEMYLNKRVYPIYKINMDIADFKKLVSGYTKENFDFDEPHFSERCEENSITKEEVLQTLLYPNSNLIRIVKDRPGVFKIYFKLSKKRELKIVLDTLEHKMIKLRTVKILDSKFKLGKITSRRRY